MRTRTCTEGGSVRSQGEESHGQVREETILRRNQPDPHSDRGLTASGTEKTNLGYLTRSVCGLCYSRSSRLTHCHTLYIATSVLLFYKKLNVYFDEFWQVCTEIHAIRHNFRFLPPQKVLTCPFQSITAPIDNCTLTSIVTDQFCQFLTSYNTEACKNQLWFFYFLVEFRHILLQAFLQHCYSISSCLGTFVSLEN